MTTKNVAAQASKMNTRSFSLKSYEASVTSSQRAHTMKTRSMAKVAVSTAARKAASSPSKFQDLNTQHKVSSGTDEIQKLILQAPICEVEDYYSSDSSAPSPKEARMSELEVESSDTVIMPVMMTGAANLEEQLASMKAILDRLSKESAEKDAQIKRQNDQIAELTKKLEKKFSEASNKGSGAEDSDKESHHSEESDNDRKAKKDCSLSSMSVEQIQSLIANAVKAQLGGGSHKTHLYTKPYTKRIDALRMPHGYQPPKFNKFDGKGNPKQHVAHFIETCSNAGTEGDRLVK